MPKCDVFNLIFTDNPGKDSVMEVGKGKGVLKSFWGKKSSETHNSSNRKRKIGMSITNFSIFFSDNVSLYNTKWVGWLVGVQLAFYMNFTLK